MSEDRLTLARRPIMPVADHQSLEELQRLERAQVRAKQRLRLRVIVLAKGGKTAPQVEEALGLSRRSVHRVAQNLPRSPRHQVRLRGPLLGASMIIGKRKRPVRRAPQPRTAFATTLYL